MTQTPYSRFAAIDALRGIAALLVVWQHSSESFVKLPGIAQHGSLLAQIAIELDFGRIGIICFFLISGFVIPSSFKQSNKNALIDFGIRRFFRLYPAYWLSLLLIVVYNLFIGIKINPSTVIANTSMLQSFFTEPHLIGLYWTLQVELIFYTMCALLFYFRILNNNKTIFIIILMSFCLFVTEQAMGALTNFNHGLSKEFQLLPYLLSIMFLGSFYRKIYDLKVANRELSSYTLLSTIMCFGLPLFLLLSSILGFEIIKDSFRFGASHFIALLLFGAGLLLLNRTPKILLWLGTISYSIYLFHPIVLQSLIRIVKKSDLPYIQGLHLSIYIIMTAIISIIIASIVYKTLEKPAIKLGKKLSK